jgi:threonine-phosphate decarboxylase
MRHGGDIYRNKVNMDLSVNLNPMGTPEAVTEAVENALKKACVYPDIRQEEVRRSIAGFLGTESEYVYAGNGASELIQAVVRAEAPKKAVLFEPGFSGYEHALKSIDCSIVRQQLKEENGFALSREDLGILDRDTDLVFICDPINPSGRNIDDEALDELFKRARENDITVCMDESFFLMSEKARKTPFFRYKEAVKKRNRLYIISSLTKILAMPGIRMGYVMSSADNIEKLIRQLPEWNLSVTAEAGICTGLKTLKDTDFLEESSEMIAKERSYLSVEMKKFNIKVFESDTAFIMCKAPEDLYEKLLERGVLIRDLSGDCGAGKGYYRIAVADHGTNESFIGILHNLFLQKSPKKV